MFFSFSPHALRLKIINKLQKPTKMCCSQAVTVKEALAARGRHLRRSISTPNVQHVKAQPLLRCIHVDNKRLTL